MGLGFGLRGPDLGLGLDKNIREKIFVNNIKKKVAKISKKISCK